MEYTTLVTTLALTMGAAFCSGINLYATVAVLGCLHRFSESFVLPGDLAVLGNEWIILTAAILYTVEFVADKVPAVDSAWDSVHTFIRVPAGAVIAAMALGDVPVEAQIVAGLLGGSLALGAHATKATTRLAAHSTGTSPIVSPVVSVVEDVLVVGTIGLIAANPVLALFVLAVLLIVSFVLLRTFWVLARRVFRTIFRREEAMPAAAA